MMSMFKQVSLLKKRPDLSMAEFENYYEFHHSPILTDLMPGMLRYQRRYVGQDETWSGPSAQPRQPIPFDCMTEVWCASREHFSECAAGLADPAAYQRLYADEENLFASHDNPLFSVDEVEGGSRPSDEDVQEPYRVISLLQVACDEPERLRQAFEQEFAEPLGEVFAAATSFVRRYVQLETNPVVGEPIAIPFNLMLDTSWRRRDDWQAARERLSAFAQSGGRGPIASLNGAERWTFAVTDRETAMGAGASR